MTFDAEIEEGLLEHLEKGRDGPDSGVRLCATCFECYFDSEAWECDKCLKRAQDVVDAANAHNPPMNQIVAHFSRPKPRA